jgi:hypothetical protein
VDSQANFGGNPHYRVNFPRTSTDCRSCVSSDIACKIHSINKLETRGGQGLGLAFGARHAPSLLRAVKEYSESQSGVRRKILYVRNH